MKKKVLNFVILLLIVSSCAEKTIPLANGKMVTENYLNRKSNQAFRHANRVANKAVRGSMSRKQIREFLNSKGSEVTVDTIQ